MKLVYEKLAVYLYILYIKPKSLVFVLKSKNLHFLYKQFCEGHGVPPQLQGIIHILHNHYPELIDGILRPEVATIGCGQRPQHY